MERRKPTLEVVPILPFPNPPPPFEHVSADSVALRTE